MTTVRELNKGRKERKKGNNISGGKKESTSSCIISLVPQFGQCYQQTELDKRYNGRFTSVLQLQIMK